MQDELSAQDIWEVHEGEIRRPGVQHLVITALLIGVGTVTGVMGSFSASVGFGVTFFWPAIAIQVVGGMWYGIWGGAVAAGIFPIISNMAVGTPPVVSLLWIPPNVIQGMLVGIVFREMKLDPRLTTFKDYAVFILVGGILASIPGAFYGPWIGKLFGLFTERSYPLAVLAWLVGNGSCAIVFGILLLKALSPIVIRTKTFCKTLVA